MQETSNERARRGHLRILLALKCDLVCQKRPHAVTTQSESSTKPALFNRMNAIIYSRCHDFKRGRSFEANSCSLSRLVSLSSVNCHGGNGLSKCCFSDRRALA
jgi:hypothetical protein